MLKEPEFEFARRLLDDVLDRVKRVADIAGLILISGPVVRAVLKERFGLTDDRRGAEKATADASAGPARLSRDRDALLRS